MPPASILSSLLGHLAAAPSRTGSLIVTIFGDAIVPRGGTVWLGTLVDILKAMGVGDGVVRTAVSRLAADDWLMREKIGRNSYYRLSEKGRATFADATRRIYGGAPAPWTGALKLAVMGQNGDRAALRGALAEAGWGTLAPTVAVTPETGGDASAGGDSGTGPLAGDRDDSALAGDGDDGALVLTATGEPETLRRLAALAWPLSEVAERYAHVVDAVGPVAAALEGGAAFTDLEALIARILIVHEYRRAILKDPLLPAELCPEGWPAPAARALCARVYRRLVPAAERWLDANAVDDHGPLPAPDAAFHRRFGEGG
jgi:phenylacetic acid degradation operon negative regulatory protein